ncbi:hypothetical protein A4G20_07915 [Pasteurellaceae bacterium RH1A]|nr:hypothetical protein A4G20_07915 [Pasteurellaceae bacterium RH1A]
MLFGLSIVFIPLFLGYLFKTNQRHILDLTNKITTYCLYLILLAMGISLGQLDDLASKLPQIGYTALVMTVIIHLCNIGGLMLFDKASPLLLKKAENEAMPSRLKQLMESLKLCATTVLGGVIGYVTKGLIDFPLHGSTYVLVVMIFCVGIQLRNSGIPLREVFLNKRGILTSLVFMASSLIGGLITALCVGMPIMKGLAFAAGFGWYSLSSVLINDAWGAMDGSIAFFNDLSREIFCLFSIPFFMRAFPSTAVGLGGATALDCTLPIIQKAGGIQVVPLAISFGFIVNIVAPLLLALFIGLA